jgi:transcriptional regulator with XRE-family HTH domain
MKRAKDLHVKWLKDPKDRAEYEFLRAEFDLANALITARTKAGLTQQQLARRMKTSQSFVARLEGGSIAPTWNSLKRYAKATGNRLRIEFEPAAA